MSVVILSGVACVRGLRSLFEIISMFVELSAPFAIHFCSVKQCRRECGGASSAKQQKARACLEGVDGLVQGRRGRNVEDGGKFIDRGEEICLVTCGHRVRRGDRTEKAP